MLILLVGCNYWSSGTLDDDPRAWSLAFAESRPSLGITINKSRYWSSSHWSAEYIWHFDLTLTDDAIEEMLANSEVKRIDLPDNVDGVVLNRPRWFLPDGDTGYTAYTMSGAVGFIMYVNLETGRSYWTASQL